MPSLSTILEKALPVFVMLAIGVLCFKRQILSRESIGGMKKLVVNITLPAVMLSAFMKAEYSLSRLMIPALMFLVCGLMLIFGRVGCKWLRIPGRLSPYLATGFEAGMLGYALFALLFPGEGSSAFAIVDLGQVLFVFTVYKALLSGREGLKGVLYEALRAPTVWAIVIGILIGASGLYSAFERIGVSGTFDAVTAFIAAPTGAVILLTIGYDLASGKILWKKTSSLILLRLLSAALGLAIVWGINHFLLGGLIHFGALLLMFALPPPYVLPVFADVEEERADVSSALSVLTVISLLLFMILTIVYS